MNEIQIITFMGVGMLAGLSVFTYWINHTERRKKTSSR